MSELLEATNMYFKEKRYHPLLVIANFVVEFLKIHPFQDGNGRISRVLTNLLMLQGGYLYMPYVSHEKYIEDNKSDYYLALRNSQKTFGKKDENIAPWFEFFFNMILKQAEAAINLMSNENIEKLLSEQQLAVWRFVENLELFSTGDVVVGTSIPRPTVKQALEVLLRLKRVERIGQGRGARYKVLK
jgi:Fic family protein